MTPREVIKRCVLGLSAGAERIFWFRLAAPAGDTSAYSRAGLLREDLSPRPAYTAYRTLAHLLQGSRSPRPLDLGSGIQAFEFIRPQGAVFVLWSEEKTTVRLPLRPGRIEIIDITGRGTVQDVPAELTLSPTPTFVRTEGRD